MDVSVKQGLQDRGVFLRLDRISQFANDRLLLRGPLQRAARMVMLRAKALAPKDTGFLRSQIISWTNWRKTDQPLSGFVTVARRAKRLRSGKLKSQRLADKASQGRKSAVVTAFYGRYVEHGTSKMEAEPFLAPALDQVGDDALDGLQHDAVALLKNMLEKGL